MFRKNTFKLAKENLENANKPKALKKTENCCQRHSSMKMPGPESFIFKFINP